MTGLPSQGVGRTVPDFGMVCPNRADYHQASEPKCISIIGTKNTRRTVVRSSRNPMKTWRKSSSSFPLPLSILCRPQSSFSPLSLPSVLGRFPLTTRLVPSSPWTPGVGFVPTRHFRGLGTGGDPPVGLPWWTGVDELGTLPVDGVVQRTKREGPLQYYVKRPRLLFGKL